MNHREPPLSPADPHGSRLSLLLGVLLAWATTGGQAQTRSYSIAVLVHHQTEATPYLQATGAPPLRFQDAALPLHPAPAAPGPADSPAPTATPATTPEPTASTRDEPSPAPGTPAEPGNPATSASELPVIPETAPATAKTPAPILPDDVRPPIRPEDFLPYFQIPGSARTPADVTLLVPVPKAPPAPGPLPPSSATYTQSPP